VSADQPQAWRDLFVMLGGAAGALVGLLFIVMTLHFGSITQRTDANMRITIDGARNNTYHLLTVLAEAAAVLTPQPAWSLGVELVALNLFGLRLPINIVRRYINQPITIDERGGFPMRLIVTVVAAYLLGAAGGAAVFAQQGWGLYLVAGSCVLKLVRTVLTAWVLMFGVNHAEASRSGP
jgi:hypothetical protein